MVTTIAADFGDGAEIGKSANMRRHTGKPQFCFIVRVKTLIIIIETIIIIVIMIVIIIIIIVIIITIIITIIIIIIIIK
jgi:hypothetical protein